jgi:hypothetical protein
VDGMSEQDAQVHGLMINDDAWDEDAPVEPYEAGLSRYDCLSGFVGLGERIIG